MSAINKPLRIETSDVKSRSYNINQSPMNRHPYQSKGKNSTISTETESSQEREGEFLGKKKASNKFKTQMCKNFSLYGRCRYGPRCRFAHGARELVRPQVAECFRSKRCHSFWEHGYCSYGVRCQFSHENEQWESKAVLIGVSSILDVDSQQIPGKLVSLLSR